MITRLGPSWQTTTADLALILFLVVAAAQTGEPAIPSHESPQPATMVETPSVAVFRPDSRVRLEEWLDAEGRDDRLSITVLVRRSDNPDAPALARGNDMLTRIERTGRHARMIVEPAKLDDVSVVMAYDIGNGTALAETEG